MGELCEERSEKGRGEEKKIGKKRPTTGPASLLQSGNQRKNKNYCKFVIYIICITENVSELE